MHTRDDLIKDQVKCWITYTTPETEKIVSSHLHLLPKFESGGQNGLGQGPRYCPSIETKVVRFSGREHHIWLEPEGILITLAV